MVALDDLPRLMESGSLEERKEFVRAFIASVTVHPGDERLEVQMRKIPASVLPKPGNSSVGLVAGARSDRVQRNLVALSVPLRRQGPVVRRAA